MELAERTIIERDQLEIASIPHSLNRSRKDNQLTLSKSN